MKFNRSNISAEFATVPGYPHFITIYLQHPITGSLDYERCYIWTLNKPEATKQLFIKHGWHYAHSKYNGRQLVFYRRSPGR